MTDVPNNFTLPTNSKSRPWSKNSRYKKLMYAGLQNRFGSPSGLPSATWVRELDRGIVIGAMGIEPVVMAITHPLKTTQELDVDKYLENSEASFGSALALEKGLTWEAADPMQYCDLNLETASAWEALEAMSNPNIPFGFEVLPLEGESPFSIIDESRDEDSKIRKYISFFRGSLKCPFGPKLADRISYLFDLAKEDAEEEEGEGEMSSESLKYFVYFIQSVPNLNYPDVVLTPDGNIVAEWRVDQNRHFNVEFMEDKYAHFVIFAPNQFDSQRPIRISGVAPWEELINIINAQKVASWVLNNG